MGNKKRRIAMSCLWLFMCIATLFSFSFSWIKRDWSPVVEQTGITITATSALSLNIDGRSTDAINLVDALNVSSINLQQVSNATGESDDFFYLESDGEIKNAIIKHVNRSETDGNDFGQDHGYVEFKFMLTGKSQDGKSIRQNIYLRGDTYKKDENNDYVRDAQGNPIKIEGSYLRAPDVNISTDTAKSALEAELNDKKTVEVVVNDTDTGTDTDTTTTITIIKDDYDKADITQKDAWIEAYRKAMTASYEERYQKLLNSIRISITTSGFGLDGAENTDMYGTIGLIGGEHEAGFLHSGLKPDTFDGTKLYLDGEPNNDLTVKYDQGKSDDNKIFHDFTTFVNGDKVTIGTKTYPIQSKIPILTIEPNTTHYVTIRIWLEGTDPDCTEDIAGLKFDLHLRFDSEVIELEQTTE